MTNQPTLTVDQQVVEFLEQAQRNDGQLTDQREMEALESRLAALWARSVDGGLSPQERETLESLEETLSILGDPEEMEALIESHRDYLNGNVTRGVDAIRALLAL